VGDHAHAGIGQYEKISAFCLLDRSSHKAGVFRAVKAGQYQCIDPVEDLQIEVFFSQQIVSPPAGEDRLLPFDQKDQGHAGRAFLEGHIFCIHPVHSQISEGLFAIIASAYRSENICVCAQGGQVSGQVMRRAANILLEILQCDLGVKGKADVAIDNLELIRRCNQIDDDAADYQRTLKIAAVFCWGHNPMQYCR